MDKNSFIKSLIFVIFILAFPSLSSAGSLSIEGAQDADSKAVRVKAKDEVDRLGFFGEYSYKRANGLVSRDKGKLGITANPGLKDSEGNETAWSLWFYNIASYDNIRETKENDIGGGPQYRINEYWVFSTGVIYRSQIDHDGKGFFSHRIKGQLGSLKLKYTYQHNFEESRDYRNEFEVDVPINAEWGVSHWREKHAGLHGDFETGIRYKFKW